MKFKSNEPIFFVNDLLIKLIWSKTHEGQCNRHRSLYKSN